MKQPDEVKLNREAGEALIERLERDALTSEHRRVLVQLIRFYCWLLFALQEARFSLKRLHRLLFGDKHKKRKGGSLGDRLTLEKATGRRPQGGHIAGRRCWSSGAFWGISHGPWTPGCRDVRGGRTRRVLP
jgi:hypothetical protein